VVVGVGVIRRVAVGVGLAVGPTVTVEVGVAVEVDVAVAVAVVVAVGVSCGRHRTPAKLIWRTPVWGRLRARLRLRWPAADAVST
jgi:hypothetical protein